MKQSKVLAASERVKSGETNTAALQIAPQASGPLRVRRVECLHDWIAIVHLPLDTNIELASEAKYGREGLVIGAGPGVPAQATGVLIPTSVKFGDVVVFQDRSIADVMEPKAGPMAGLRIVILKDSNIICKVRREVVYEEIK